VRKPLPAHLPRKRVVIAATDEATIEDIALELEPEDGCLSTISDDSGKSITAFTQFGIDNLQELLADG
jgi:hypothetical protein